MDLLTRLSAPARESDVGESAAVDAASACLDRFTERFNARDAQGMDAELHFPHLLLAGVQLITWPAPGGHPADFFEVLLQTGWRHTRYDAKRPVLATADKVHFVVDYSRCDAAGEPISRHRNLWIVARIGGRWGLCLRSY